MDEERDEAPSPPDTAESHLDRMAQAPDHPKEPRWQRVARWSSPERSEAIAMMLACGRYSPAQICESLDIPRSYLKTLRGSPLFMSKVRAYQAKMYDSLMEQAVGAVMEDANRNIEWLRKGREGEIVDEPASLAVRARMATALLDRQVPKAERKSETGGIRITIGSDVKEKFGRAASELEKFGAIEVDAEEIE